MIGQELIDRIQELGPELPVFIDGYEIKDVEKQTDGDVEAITIDS